MLRGGFGGGAIYPLDEATHWCLIHVHSLKKYSNIAGQWTVDTHVW